MIDFGTALEIVRAHFANRRTAVESVALADALGRTLARPLVAPNDVPGFRHSAMDGFAVASVDLSADAETTLPIAATVFAGATEIAPHRRGTAVRIMTGAPMPDGADTVVIKENARIDGESVALQPGTAPRANVRLASDDYEAGVVAVAAGTRIGASEIAVAASFGFTTLPVHARPRVAILVTGDELESPRASVDQPPAPLAPGRRYDSNGAMLAALVVQAGADVVRVDRAIDDLHAIEQQLHTLVSSADLVLTSGGVSAGEADHMPTIIERLGRIHFWKVSMRPGMPVLFGEVDGTAVFSLPGNPVSVFATFIVFVRAALDGLVGAGPAGERYARLATAIDKKHDRFELRRARIECTSDGVFVAHPHPNLSSGALRSVVESDALIELDAVARRFEAGEVVRVRPLR